ncbi:thioesterase II family protein [Anaerosporobacter sp.]
MNNIKVFCIPFAGGSAGSYYSWKKRLADLGFNLCAVELKGRGQRFREPLYDSFEEAVEDIFEQIQMKVKEEPFVIFGHSMGGMLAYAVAEKIVKTMGHRKFVLVISGVNPPHARVEQNLHKLTKEDFMIQMEKLGGIPKEVLDNKELYDMCARIMFSDVKMLELYKFPEKQEPLPVPFTILYGEKDSVTNERIMEWKNYSSISCESYKFTGGHFYIIEETSKVCALIRKSFIKLPL